MASEYLKWKYRDVRPDPPRVLTPKERRANWWHYHKWYVVSGLVLLLVLADIGRHVLTAPAPPDHQFAYVGSRPLPDDAVSALEEALSALASDRSGPVTVRIEQYVDASADGDADAVLYAQASQVRLMADLERGDSAYFLLEDPGRFQRDYEALSDDGPFPWTGCPALASLPLGGYETRFLDQTVRGSVQSLCSDLYLARRAPPEDGDDAFWEILTEGAVP